MIAADENADRTGTASLPRPLSAERIVEAMQIIDPAVLRTPLLQDTPLDRLLDCRLSLKIELLTPIRSFKGRGTDLFVATLPDDRPLVCASAGNFGQGLARSGTARGISVTVFAAEHANPLKLAAMRRLGAEVLLSGSDFDAAKEEARRHAERAGALYVEDGAIPEVAEGAGTIALEVTERGSPPDVALIPLGNGALATGMGAWFRHASPATRVIGVVATGAPTMLRSFQAREPVACESAATIADGIAVRVPVPYAVREMRWTVDEVVAVDDATVIRAMRLLHEQLGVVVEPAGAAGVAALLQYPERWPGARVLTPLCGGNVTPSQAAEWLLRRDEV